MACSVIRNDQQSDYKNIVVSLANDQQSDYKNIVVSLEMTSRVTTKIIL